MGHPLGLVVLVLSPVADDLIAGPLLGPQRLGLAGDVVGDDGVGRIQNGLGRAEVLVEGDGRGIRKRLFEVEDVGDVRTPEPVDRLVAVPHHHDVAVSAGELHSQRVLHGVGVLILVDQDVGEPSPVVLEHVGVLVEQTDRVEQQVVEVHGIGRQHPPLIEVEDVGNAAVEDGDGRLAELDRPLLARLGLADLAEHRARRHLLGVDVELAGDDLDQAARVGIVVDGETALVAEPVAMGPQDPHARRVEGRDPHAPRSGPDQLGDPVLHLTGRLIGEGDGQDLPGGGIAAGDEVGDPAGEHSRLTGSGPGHDQQWPAAVDDGCRLGRCESDDELFSADRLERRRCAKGHLTAVGVLAGAPAPGGHSHSMVPGGLDVMSSATRLTPSTSLMMREERRSRRS